NLYEMADLSVPIIATIIGEGGSGGALALAVADEVWMLENSIYAVLPPEGFASILWKDSSRADEAADLMKITAQELKDLDVIEQVIPETFKGETVSDEAILRRVKADLTWKLKDLAKKDPTQLVQERYERFRKF
ncbi:MAG: acetyl-CoA carboxylase carboxyl transferase subunit alpha, partial [Atopostipes suicloacalis]|nr:acetyl-CoA carboxylase carboxyl transferase subunit alpha [Atopostipes suicloacalis]